MANPNGRPRSETVKLTKTARERFDRQLAEKLPDIFTALFEAGTKEKDTAALSLLVNRAVPVRKGVPVNFKTRPLSNPSRMRRSIRRHPHSHRQRRADAGRGQHDRRPDRAPGEPLPNGRAARRARSGREGVAATDIDHPLPKHRRINERIPPEHVGNAWVRAKEGPNHLMRDECHLAGNDCPPGCDPSSPSANSAGRGCRLGCGMT